MCELFGISAPHPVDAGAWLKTFYSHGSKNPHGWGLAVFAEDDFCHAGFGSLEKEPVRADHSAYLHSRLQQRISAVALIAHIREATIGSMEYCNTHPFRLRDRSGRFWTLAHNGTIFEDGLLRSYVGAQEGQTDSERILFYIIDRINRALDKKRRNGPRGVTADGQVPGDMKMPGNAPAGTGKRGEIPAGTGKCGETPAGALQAGREAECLRHPALSPLERCEILADVVRLLSPENKLNLLVCDGEILYVHTNRQGTLYHCQAGGSLLFATVPFMTGTSAHWEEVPFTSLCAYQNGRQIYQGDPHGHGFVDDPEKYRSLMMAYAAL